MRSDREPATSSEDQARGEVVHICRLLWERGYVAAGDGNVSVRLGRDRLLVTPSGFSKGFLRPEQLVLTNLQGVPLPHQTEAAQGLRPSSELRLHCEAYRQRPDIGAVIHAHPVAAVACSLAGISLAEAVLPEVVLDLGTIPTTRYATPASEEGPEAIRDLIRSHDALVLDRHGSVTVGAGVWDAYLKLERMEHAAHILVIAHQLGGARGLPPDEAQRLLAMHRRLRGTAAGDEH